MSQVSTYTLRRSPPDYPMAEHVAALEAVFSALGSFNRGAMPPDNPFEGMPWWDTSGAPVEVLKRYTASAGWASLLSVNVTTGAVSSTITDGMIVAAMLGAACVTAEKIAAQAVTLAKLARVGTSGDLLSSNGANADPSYKSASTLGLASQTWVNALIDGLNLGTMATQSAASIAITGGSIAGITDLAVADGGTGASTAAQARVNLGADNASNLTTGTVAPARLGSGTPSVDTILRGDGVWASAGNSLPSALGVGSQVLAWKTGPSTSWGAGDSVSASELTAVILRWNTAVNPARMEFDTGPTLSGTWRAMASGVGVSSSYNVTLWMRIA